MKIKVWEKKGRHFQAKATVPQVLNPVHALYCQYLEAMNRLKLEM